MKCSNITYWKWSLNFLQVHAFRVLIKFSKIFPIMLALCLLLLGTYYALNYAGIIGRGLTGIHSDSHLT